MGNKTLDYGDFEMHPKIREALSKFARHHGQRKWKTELRCCWMNAHYPGFDSDDSSYLQMARNMGVDLDKLTYEELTSQQFRFATDSESGTITAVDFDEACRKLDAMVPASAIDNGAWGWVENHDGYRYEAPDPFAAKLLAYDGLRNMR